MISILHVSSTGLFGLACGERLIRNRKPAYTKYLVVPNPIWPTGEPGSKGKLSHPSRTDKISSSVSSCSKENSHTFKLLSKDTQELDQGHNM